MVDKLPSKQSFVGSNPTAKKLTCCICPGDGIGIRARFKTWILGARIPPRAPY